MILLWRIHSTFIWTEKNLHRINMKKIGIVCVVLLALLLPTSVGAVEFRKDSQVTIDTQIDDDLIVSGGTVIINAPVNGDVFAVAGTIEVNAPVGGDLIAAGAQITVTSTVKGKIIAGGGTIDLKGTAEKILVFGGAITLHSTAVVERYAVVSGGTAINAGTIREDLIVSTGRFQNTGSYGKLTLIEPTPAEGIEALLTFVLILSILVKIGYLILGLIFVKYFSGLFFRIEKEVRESTVKKIVMGFIFIIVTALVVLVLGITLVGIPFAAVVALLFMIALMVAGLFVSYSLGNWVLTLIKVKTGDMMTFVVGFVILNVLFAVPYVGIIFRIVAVSLGFGAIHYAVRANWKSITVPKA